MRSLVQIAADRLALVCIDLQEEHRHDPRYSVEGYNAVLANVARLQASARKRHVPVLHAAYVIDAKDGKPFNPLQPDGTPVFSAKDHPLTEICPEVAPAAGEIKLVKAEPSVFGRGGLLGAVQAVGAEWIVVAGAWTEACVDASVKDAIRAGLRVILVKDACGSGTRAMHEVGVLNMANRLYGGAIATTDDACRIISGDAADVWMLDGAVPFQYTLETVGKLYREL